MIHIDHIHKKFGTHTVLNDISIKIEEGQIFGLLGQNGAGKTTLMKIMLGLLKANQGDVRILGESVRFGNTPTNLLATQQQIFEQCIQQQIAIQSIEIEQSTLEDVFLEVIQS